MKLQGGHTPRIAGRPSSVVEEVQPVARLWISLARHGAIYAPLVKEGDPVRLGTALAERELPSGRVCIPSPAAGRVAAVRQGNDEQSAAIAIDTGGDGVDDFFHPFVPDRITADTTREVLARGGIWPFFWSSATGGLPVGRASSPPQARGRRGAGTAESPAPGLDYRDAAELPVAPFPKRRR